MMCKPLPPLHTQTGESSTLYHVGELCLVIRLYLIYPNPNALGSADAQEESFNVTVNLQDTHVDRKVQ